MNREMTVAAAFVAVLAALPFLGVPGHILNLMIFMMIITIAAQGWNMLGGFGGLASFGHAAFFGTGAYTTAILQSQYGVNAWLGMACGIALGAIVGTVIGFLSFRSGLRGSYFALITLAFAEVFRVLANSTAFTGGAAGILVPLTNDPAQMQFADRRIFFLVALAFVVIGLAVTFYLQRSRFGAYLIALRENEQAAQALGVDALRVKLGAITLSAGTTAAAGCLYVQNFLYLDANIAYGTWISIEALFAAIVGGLSTVLGPLIGAVVLLGLGEVTKSFGGGIPGLDLLVFGVILILCVAFAPNGIHGFILSLRDRLRAGIGRGRAKEA